MRLAFLLILALLLNLSWVWFVEILNCMCLTGGFTLNRQTWIHFSHLMDGGFSCSCSLPLWLSFFFVNWGRWGHKKLEWESQRLACKVAWRWPHYPARTCSCSCVLASPLSDGVSVASLHFHGGMEWDRVQYYQTPAPTLWKINLQEKVTKISTKMWSPHPGALTRPGGQSLSQAGDWIASWFLCNLSLLDVLSELPKVACPQVCCRNVSQPMFIFLDLSWLPSGQPHATSHLSQGRPLSMTPAVLFAVISFQFHPFSCFSSEP